MLELSNAFVWVGVALGSGTFPFPELNATLNTVSALFLTAGFIAIKRGRVTVHRSCMVCALAVSVGFLASYITYHYQVGGGTTFSGSGGWRVFYYTMLITHIVLAIAVIPLVIQTLRLALCGHFHRHRAWARVTFPIWYYVSITGVLIYLFLYQWF